MLFFSLCRLDTEALAFAVQECATALVSIDWSQDFAWQDSDRGFAIEYKYQIAISTCSIAFDEEGKMIPTAWVNSFEIRNSLEGDLVIEQRETERRRA